MGDLSLITGSGRSPGEENGYPFQYSCLENSMNRRSWRATVHRVEQDWRPELSHSFSPKITRPISGWIKTVWLQNLLPSLLTISPCLVSRRNENGRDGRCSWEKIMEHVLREGKRRYAQGHIWKGKEQKGKKGETSKQGWRNFGDSVDEAMPGGLTARI